MWPTLLITFYCVFLVFASLAGGWLPSVVRLTHTRMQLMMSFVGGLMMGVALLHLLPHAVVETNSLDYAAWACVLGLLAMFLTIRVSHVHQHGPVAEGVPDAEGVPEDAAVGDPVHSHVDSGADCARATPHCAHHADPSSHQFSWMGLFLGLSIHSVIDGVAVGASVVAAAEHGAAWGLLGVGTFLAVLFHKPLDSLSIISVMAAGHWSRRARDLVNLGFSLICPLGALLFYFGVRGLGTGQHLLVGCALGFSAGVFLCISLADILPEIQFHRHDRFKLTGALLAGVLMAFAIGLFEPEHAHDHRLDLHQHGSPACDHDDDHGHDHADHAHGTP
jgi:zinc and cadmium transporter